MGYQKYDWNRLGYFHKKNVEFALSEFRGFLPFDIVAFDASKFNTAELKKCAEDIEKYIIFISFRILIIVEKFDNLPDKLLKLKKNRIVSICVREKIEENLAQVPKEAYSSILKYIWLKERNFENFEDGFRLYINLDEEEKSKLDETWKSIAENVSEKIAELKIRIFNKNSISQIDNVPQRSNLYDRHSQFVKFKKCEGIELNKRLRNLNFKGYYNEWGISSPLYLKLFNPPDSMSGRLDLIVDLMESSVLRILILDERIGEIALKKEKFKTLAAMNIFILSHVDDISIGNNIKENAFILKKQGNGLIAKWNSIIHEKFDFLIIHQGHCCPK